MSSKPPPDVAARHSAAHKYPPLYSAGPPPSFVTAVLAPPDAEWPDGGESSHVTDPSLIAWYYDSRDGVSVQVYAAAAMDLGSDPVIWALGLERAFAPAVVQQESEVEYPAGFHVWTDGRGNRSATMRALQATWSMPGGEEYEDVIFGFAERDGVLYRVTLAMPPPWGWWDVRDAKLPQQALQRARVVYQFFIGPLQAQPVHLPPRRPDR